MGINFSKMVPFVILIIIALPLFIINYYTSLDNDGTGNEEQFQMVVGFYMCGEEFNRELMDEDISDTLGLSSDKIIFYYLVDYEGHGNTEFFRAENYSRIRINISDILPYDSNELNMGSKEVFSGFVDYISDIEAREHCLIV